jgi:hypothetical protein
MVNLLAWIENEIETTEADVVALVIKIKQEATVFESDINTALKWIASQVPAFVSGIQAIENTASQLGVTSIPAVSTAIAAANVAMAGLNKLASDINSGSSTTQALVDGYIAVKQTQVVAAQAAVAAAQASPKNT